MLGHIQLLQSPLFYKLTLSCYLQVTILQHALLNLCSAIPCNVIIACLIFSVSGVIGQFCAGCFTPVTTDWQSNPTLVKVVEKAVTGTRQYLMTTQPQLFGSSDLKLDKINNFQSQVIFALGTRTKSGGPNCINEIAKFY